MKRAARLEPVQRVVDETERKFAEHLAAGERQVAACQKKLDELESYRRDYSQGFATRAGGGMGARELHDYQAFMTRLQEAIRQQAAIVDKAVQDRDLQLKRWQEAAQRSKAIGHVIENWHSEERRSTERREQRESDERGQRRRSISHEH